MFRVASPRRAAPHITGVIKRSRGHTIGSELRSAASLRSYQSFVAHAAALIASGWCLTKKKGLRFFTPKPLSLALYDRFTSSHRVPPESASPAIPRLITLCRQVRRQSTFAAGATMGACELPLGSVRVEPWAVSAEPFPVSFYSVGGPSSPSRLLFHASSESERTPNHALQRTAPAVTARASAAAFPPTMHGPRQPPPSLSLGSLAAPTRRPTH